MPKYFHGTVTITVNAIDVSDHVSMVEVGQKKDDLDYTAFGAASHVHGVGLGDNTIKMTLFQDFAAASIDSILSPIFAAGTPVPIVVRPTSAAVSATNPKWTMQGILQDYTPISGKVGDVANTEITWTNGDATGLVRAIV